jgi:double-strand break repair protein MRE11
LPEFLDLVIWGHEHECRIRPEFNELQRFYVSQPGSSVITSLSESELEPKHVAILRVNGKKFKLEPLPLRSVRQFMMETVVLAECGLKETDKNLEAKIEQVLTKRIDKLVAECGKNRYCYENGPVKPLIRLKVDYTNFEPINEIRFAHKMVAKLANPRNIFQFYKYIIRCFAC